MRTGFPEFFIDTNVLAYAYDAKEVAKRERAIQVVEAVGATGNAAISTQVLGELYSILTQPKKFNLPHEVAEATVRRFLLSWTVLEIAPMQVLDAMRAVGDHRMSYYDALIWATARANGIYYILSEDGHDGGNIEGVRTLNPFAPSFDLDWLG